MGGLLGAKGYVGPPLKDQFKIISLCLEDHNAEKFVSVNAHD